MNWGFIRFGSLGGGGKQVVKRIRGLSAPTVRALSSVQGSSVPSYKTELAALFKDACDGLAPTIVDANKAANADFALTTGMELFRMDRKKYATPKDAAVAIIQRCSDKTTKFELAQANFYVNATVSSLLLEERITLLSRSQKNLPPPHVSKKQRVLIDFSSPNIAKQMHVGHLRSTVIGNCLANMNEFVGNETIRVNHIGDWGTQFGTLLTHMKDIWGGAALSHVQGCSISDLTKLYQESKKRMEIEPEFENRAKQTTVTLQSGENAELAELWKALVASSIADFNRMYSRLNIPQPDNWYVGESFYQDKLQEAIRDLEAFITTTSSDQSVLLFTALPEAKFKKEDGNGIDEVPLILRKSDGGIGYDATDVAAARYRLKTLNAERLLYVTDSGQSLHFHLVFHAARLAGWTKSAVDAEASLQHIPFGVVRKASGGRIKTREGGAETLDSLLDKANERIFKILQSKRKDGWTESELAVLNQLSSRLGIACVVFAELKTNRTMDYEFNLDRMCSPDGDSAVYILHVLEKILRHCSFGVLDSELSTLTYNCLGASVKERALAINVSKFHDVVESALAANFPHIICQHALSLAGDVSSFLEDPKESLWTVSPGLSSARPHSERGKDRLVLIHAVRSVLLQHLQLIGLAPFVDQMHSSLSTIRQWKHVEVL